MRKTIYSNRQVESTAYPHYYKDYIIIQQDDGLYYICDPARYTLVVEEPFESIWSAEYYIDNWLSY